MPRKNALLQLSRKVHLYFGLFISPALLFFAFTGAYQTLGLHEPSSNYKPPTILATLAQIHKKQTDVVPVRHNNGPEGAGRPFGASGQAGPNTAEDPGPGAASSQGRRHHDHDSSEHTSAIAPAASALAPTAASVPGAPGVGPGGARPPQTLQAKQKQHLPLKIYFVLVSLGLLLSTLTGIYMAYKYDRNKLLVTAILIAGVVIPLVLLRF